VGIWSKFQSLIGTIKTDVSNRGICDKIAVSIPYRDDKNAYAIEYASARFEVSIPYRDDKNTLASFRVIF